MWHHAPQDYFLAYLAAKYINMPSCTAGLACKQWLPGLPTLNSEHTLISFNSPLLWTAQGKGTLPHLDFPSKKKSLLLLTQLFEKINEGGVVILALPLKSKWFLPSLSLPNKSNIPSSFGFWVFHQSALLTSLLSHPSHIYGSMLCNQEPH